MSKFESKADLVAKVEWEGGVIDSIDYGIKAADLPDGTPQEVIDAWRRLEDTGPDEDIIIDWLDAP